MKRKRKNPKRAKEDLLKENDEDDVLIKRLERKLGVRKKVCWLNIFGI